MKIMYTVTLVMVLTVVSGTYHSGSPRRAQEGSSADTGILLGEDSWLARGSQVQTHTTDSLRQAG